MAEPGDSVAPDNRVAPRDPHHLLQARLTQPDQVSCGATVAVLARTLLDPARASDAAAWTSQFADEVRATHRSLTGVRVAGAAQLPWPRRFGTPPWALAHSLAGASGRRHTVRLARGPWTGSGLERLRTATAQGHLVGLYVGSRTVPRHVVLALPEALLAPTPVAGEGIAVYNPASGRVGRLGTGWRSGGLTSCGWSWPWFVVLPR